MRPAAAAAAVPVGGHLNSPTNSPTEVSQQKILSAKRFVTQSALVRHTVDLSFARRGISIVFFDLRRSSLSQKQWRPKRLDGNHKRSATSFAGQMSVGHQSLRRAPFDAQPAEERLHESAV